MSQCKPKRPGDYQALERALMRSLREALEGDGYDPALADGVAAPIWNLAMDAVNAANEQESPDAR